MYSLIVNERLFRVFPSLLVFELGVVVLPSPHLPTHQGEDDWECHQGAGEAQNTPAYLTTF